MPISERARRKSLLAIAWFSIAVPMIAFFGVLLRESQNLPELDDYNAVLGFLNTFFTLHGAVARLSFFLSTVHVQYKLLFEHLVFVLEAGMTGHVNFFFLQQLGNCFVPLITLMLWLLFRPSRPFGDKLLLFVPVVSLLFSLQYAGTLDWAMGSLQNMTVVFFALLCFYLLRFNRWSTFSAACLSLICAIASSQNGFFVGLVGIMWLLQMRRGVHTCIWIAVQCLMVGIYAFHYHPYHYPPALSGHVVVFFPFIFVGSLFGRYMPSLLLGAFMAITIVYLTSKGWRKRDPETFYTAMFILLTALAVDYGRNMFGTSGAFVPRYRIYSQLSVAILYMAVLHLKLDQILPQRLIRPALSAFACMALLFCAVTDTVQSRILHHRMELVRNHYSAWTCDPEHVSLVPDEDPTMGNPDKVIFRKQAVVDMRRSIDLGLYHPPVSRACDGSLRANSVYAIR